MINYSFADLELVDVMFLNTKVSKCESNGLEHMNENVTKDYLCGARYL